jgi:hypothetical protein
MRLMGLIGAAWLAAVALAPASALAQEADPKAAELGAELIDAAGTKSVMNQMMNQLGPGLTQLVVQANPGKEDAAREVMQSFVLPRIQASVPELMHEGALLYAKHFTNEELGQMIAFYKSPVGQKLVLEQPKMMQEMAVVAQTWGQKIALEALKAYSDEFKKRGLQTPI